MTQPYSKCTKARAALFEPAIERRSARAALFAALVARTMPAEHLSQARALALCSSQTIREFDLLTPPEPSYYALIEVT